MSLNLSFWTGTSQKQSHMGAIPDRNSIRKARRKALKDLQAYASIIFLLEENFHSIFVQTPKLNDFCVKIFKNHLG